MKNGRQEFLLAILSVHQSMLVWLLLEAMYGYEICR